MGITRRDLLRATAAGTVLTSIGLPKWAFGASDTIKIGFLAPLTGEVSAWGLPGLYGCEIWAEKVNAAGGINVGGQQKMVEMVSFDDEFQPDKALQGAKKLVLDQGVKIILTLGGDTFPGIQRFVKEQKMLTTTLAPSDLSPESPYHIASCEVHPIYNVTGVDWLARNFPDLKTAVICAQNDSFGLPSVATYLAAFEAAGIQVLDQNIFDPSTSDFAPIVTSLLAKKPQIVCLDTCYADYVNLISQALFNEGYKGKIITCACDTYKQIIDKTSKDFVEGLVFQFPDFDDAAMNRPNVNFKNPNEFYAEYNKKHPDVWNAVSWEYASILELWKSAVEKGGSAEPMDVLTTMKNSPTLPHAFGDAKWWGKDLWGIDNALVGMWPVVTIRNGKATIEEFGDILAWWDKNKALMIKHMEAMHQMYYQRT